MKLSRTLELTVAVALAACSSDTQPSASAVVSDSAGVRIVTHPLDEPAPRWHLDPSSQVVIGGDGTGIELFGVSAALQSSDGRIVVADGGNHRLLFFDANGALMDSVGGEGEGPGEFKQITFLARVRADSLVVWDRSLRRISMLDSHGRFGRTIVLELTDSVPFADIFGVYSDGSYLASGYVDTGGPTITTGRHSLSSPVYHFGRNGAFLERTGSFPTPERYYETLQGGGFRISPALFSNETYRYGVGTRLLFASALKYELRYYRPEGTLEQVVRREARDRPVTPDARSGEIAKLVLEAPDQDHVEAVLGDMESPDLLPEIRAVFGDPLGRVWVQEFRPGDSQDGAPWHVYGADGRLLGIALLPVGFRLMDAGQDYVLAVMKDEMDLESVVYAKVIMEPVGPWAF